MWMKEYWYDWQGVNAQAFESLYDANPPELVAQIIRTLHAATGFHTAAYWLAFFAFCTAIGVSLNIARGGDAWLQFKRGVIFIAAMTFSMVIVGQTVDMLKEFFAFPRPFMVFDDVQALSVLGPESATRSFPSGHAAFIAVLIASLWPRISGFSKWLGFGFVLAVCWSRIAGGFHFPVDTVAGVLIGLILTWIVQALIFSFFHGLQSEAPHANRRYVRNPEPPHVG